MALLASNSRTLTLDEEVAIVKRAIALRQARQLVELRADRVGDTTQTLFHVDGKPMTVRGLARVVSKLEIRSGRRSRNSKRSGRDIQWKNRRKAYVAAKGVA